MQRGRGRLYLTGNLDLSSDLDVVIVVVGVRSDPETAFLQSCREIIPFIWANLQQPYMRQHIRRFSQWTRAECMHRFTGTGLALDMKENFNRNSEFPFFGAADATSA